MLVQWDEEEVVVGFWELAVEMVVAHRLHCCHDFYCIHLRRQSFDRFIFLGEIGVSGLP